LVTFEYIVVFVPLFFLRLNGRSPISFKIFKILSNEPISVFHGIKLHLVFIRHQRFLSLPAPGWALEGNTWGPRRASSLFDWYHRSFIKLDGVSVRSVQLKSLTTNCCVSLLPLVLLHHCWHHNLPMHLKVRDVFLVTYFTCLRLAGCKVWSESFFERGVWGMLWVFHLQIFTR